MNQSELGPFDLFEIFSSFLNLISIFVILSFFCFSLSRSGNRGQSNSSISFRDKDLWSRNAVRRNSSQRLFPRPLCPEYSIFCPTFCAICFAIYTLGFRPSIRCLFLRRVISCQTMSSPIAGGSVVRCQGGSDRYSVPIYSRNSYRESCL